MSSTIDPLRMHTLKKGVIEKFLKRMKRRDSVVAGPELDEVLKEILFKANEFVPSRAGSILLDDPHRKSANLDDPDLNLLYFVACFGPGSENLLGSTLSVTNGVAGKTYLTGKPYISKDVSLDRNFFKEIDIKLGRKTRSILCVPIVLGNSVCGVIELLNRRGSANYTRGELKLLEIFAGYTSTLIQNALDAKRNQELTRRDDLTGLYNDRFFHHQLSVELKKAKRTKKDVSLIFMDLDNFKSVNDKHGHLSGSRTLAEVGELMRDALKDVNASIVRYGGDEFAIILPDKGRIGAVAVAETVRVAIQDAVFLKRKGKSGEHACNIKGVITCSIGVSSYYEDKVTGRTLEEEKITFIRHADQAMYMAKETGKNRVCVGDGRCSRVPKA